MSSVVHPKTPLSWVLKIGYIIPSISLAKKKNGIHSIHQLSRVQKLLKWAPIDFVSPNPPSPIQHSLYLVLKNIYPVESPHHVVQACLILLPLQGQSWLSLTNQSNTVAKIQSAKLSQTKSFSYFGKR